MRNAASMICLASSISVKSFHAKSPSRKGSPRRISRMRDYQATLAVHLTILKPDHSLLITRLLGEESLARTVSLRNATCNTGCAVQTESTDSSHAEVFLGSKETEPSSASLLHA